MKFNSHSIANYLIILGAFFLLLALRSLDASKKLKVEVATENGLLASINEPNLRDIAGQIKLIPTGNIEFLIDDHIIDSNMIFQFQGIAVNSLRNNAAKKIVMYLNDVPVSTTEVNINRHLEARQLKIGNELIGFDLNVPKKIINENREKCPIFLSYSNTGDINYLTINPRLVDELRKIFDLCKTIDYKDGALLEVLSKF